MTQPRNPYVLGKPIRDPEDFYGREHELTELFESVLNMQPVALVGEHRCGNTSILYMLLDEGVRERYLAADVRQEILFVYANAQLAAEGPDALYRRLARSLRRHDPESRVDFDDVIDQFWIEDYLEDLADRDRRLGLLLDEFDVLADFENSFWEWFRGLITEYDMSIVVATRTELGAFRDEWGSGSPFFNMFRSIYVGAFAPGELEDFLSGTSEISGVDLAPVAEDIERISGRFPFYNQVASALFYERGLQEDLTGAPEQVADVTDEFAQRSQLHFEDIWSRLPEEERDALTWLAVGGDPDGRDGLSFRLAVPSLERRGYVVDGRIFSSVFAAYVLRQIARIEMNVDTGEVRIERRPVDLPPKEFALLRFLLENEGEVVTKDEIASAVWPEYQQDTLGVTDAMIQKTISRLRKEVDVSESAFQHIESVRGQGYRFVNASIYEVERRRSEPEEGVAVEA